MEEADEKRICDTCFMVFDSDYLLQYHRLSCCTSNGKTVLENSVEKEPPVTDRKAENDDDGDDDDGAQSEDEEDYEIEVNESEELESDYSERINMEDDDDDEEGNEETVFKPDDLDEKPFTCNLCYLVFAKLEAYNGHMDMHLNGLLPQQQSATDTSFEQIKLVVNKGMKDPIILKGKEVVSTGCKSEDPDQKPFTCNMCFLQFLGSDAYDTHMDMHLNGQLPVKGGVTIVAPVEPITLVVPNDKEASEPITLKVANGKMKPSKPITPVVPSDRMETSDDKEKMKQDIVGTVSFSAETDEKESTNVKEEGEKEEETGTRTGSAGTESDSESEEMDLKPLTCNLCYLAFTDVETYNTHMDMHLNGQLPGRRPEYIQQEVGTEECEEEMSPSEEREEKPFVWEQWAIEIPGRKEVSKLYRCIPCGKILKSKKYLKRHVNMVCGNTTKNKPTYDCNICGRTFNRSNNLKRHIRGHAKEKPFQCDFCEKAFADKWYWTQHRRMHTGELDLNDEAHPCDLCDKVLKSRNSLIKHMEIHTGIKKNICTFCGKAFLRKHQLRIHMTIHTRDKPFKCGKCDKAFACKKELSYHIRHDHYAGKPSQCTECDKSFTCESQLHLHMATHKVDEDELRMREADGDTGEFYQCDKCDKTFKHKVLLSKHKITHMKSHICPVCGKSFLWIKYLRQHLPKHSRTKVKCKECGKVFCHQSSLEEHMRETCLMSKEEK